MHLRGLVDCNDYLGGILLHVRKPTHISVLQDIGYILLRGSMRTLYVVEFRDFSFLSLLLRNLLEVHREFRFFD